MNHSTRLVRLIEIAIMTGAAVILDIVSGMFLRMPQGGSVSIMMIPIFLISFRWGVKAGLTTGFLTGIVQIAIGNLFLRHPVRLFLDYIAAFAVLGFSGLFASGVRESALNKKRGALTMYVIGGVFIGSVVALCGACGLRSCLFSETMLRRARRYGFIRPSITRLI